MRAYILLILVLGLGVISMDGMAQNEAKLDSTISITIGDYASIMLPALIQSGGELQNTNNTTIVYYDQNSKLIKIGIIGPETTAEGAKKIIDKYWDIIEAVPIRLLKNRFSISFMKSDFEIGYAYKDRYSKKMKPILVMKNGNFVLPE